MQHPDFRRYLAARLAGAFGAQMLIVALGYQVYQLTRNPLDLGLIGLSQFLPFVVLVLPAGQAADHLDRRRIMAACYALLAACAVLLAVLTIVGLPSAWPIFAVMTLFGVARAFSMPTGQALLPNLVPTSGLRQRHRGHLVNGTDRHDRRAGSGRTPLPGRAGSGVRGRRGHDRAGQPAPPGRAGRRPLRARSRAHQPSHSALRRCLRPIPRRGAGVDLARPVRRPLRRRDGPPAGLCQ